MTKAWACVTNQEAYEKYLLLTSSFLFPVRSRLGKLKKKAIIFMFPEHYNLGESNSCIISRLGVFPWPHQSIKIKVQPLQMYEMVFNISAIIPCYICFKKQTVYTSEVYRIWQILYHWAT